MKGQKKKKKKESVSLLLFSMKIKTINFNRPRSFHAFKNWTLVLYCQCPRNYKIITIFLLPKSPLLFSWPLSNNLLLSQNLPLPNNLLLSKCRYFRWSMFSNIWNIQIVDTCPRFECPATGETTKILYPYSINLSQQAIPQFRRQWTWAIYNPMHLIVLWL